MSDKITRTATIEIELSPSELAKSFCRYNEDEQAEFFNQIGKEVESWGRCFCFQLQAITDSEELTDVGRGVMSEIGDYSAKN